MITQQRGYLIHPKIQYDRTTSRIADIRTGTALVYQWLLHWSP